MLNKKYEVRDVIYGFIKLDAQERDIINAPAFQRLRRIRQLSLTEMVYPGANHTRFEHSLGVMQMATDMYDCIIEKSPKELDEYLRMDTAGINRWRKIIRLAALLHDIGHPPFSHSGEDLLPIKNNEKDPGIRYKHEAYSISIIKQKFKDYIEYHPVNINYGITVNEVTALLGDQSVLNGSFNAIALLWKGLISGQLDADRADYLLRDSLHSGVSYGIYDRNRLTRCMVIGINETDSPIIAVQHGGWHIAESLVIARYQMFSQLYFHKTRRIYDYHISEAVKNILEEMGMKDKCYPLPDNVDAYLDFDDWAIWGALKQGMGGDHGRRILERKHYKCLHETRLAPSDDEKEKIKNLFEENDKAGFRLFWDRTSTKWYTFDKDIFICNEASHLLTPLSEHSDIVKSMVSIPQIERLYIER